MLLWCDDGVTSLDEARARNLIMSIYTSMIGTDKGSIVKCDTIEHDGGLWIVPQWLVSHGEGVQRPAYAIRVDTLPLAKFEAGSKFGHYYLQQGHIPIDVLEGRSTQGPHGEYEVMQSPDIRLPVGRA
jgi:hypothetical protein